MTAIMFKEIHPKLHNGYVSRISFQYPAHNPVTVNGAVNVCNSYFVFFLSQILDATPESHPDHQNIVDALAKAEELCNQVNEGVRERDNSDKLEWIQQHVQCDGLAEVREALLLNTAM